MPKWTEEQLKAINTDGSNIIVSAGAGSGKTAVLTERVITKIRNGVSINELLILTFTKAAAAEMKERIRIAIKKENNKQELDLLDSAYITTFDSFALSIVKKYHYLANISKNVNIGNENIFKLEKEKILDEIFERHYQQKDKEFIKLISDFCVKDDIEIRDYILKIREKLDAKVDSEKYLKEYLDSYYSDNNTNNIVKSYTNILRSKIYEIKESLEDLSHYVDSNYYEKLEEILTPLLGSSTYKEIKDSLNIKLPPLPRGSDIEVKSKKEAISDLIKSLKELTIYESENEIISSINMTKDYAKVIIEILLELDKKIKAFKFANDIYEFNDIALLAIKIVKDNSDAREELKNSFNEILIDEYQDTSDIQETFINLIGNNNVYVVGDIKQSIYRFRNANPYIFKNKYDIYTKNIDGIKIDLNKNFRSRSEVINNINLIFSCIMDEDIGGANYKKDHEMSFGNATYLEDINSNMDILTYNEESAFTKSEIEAFIIANDIKNKVDNKYKVLDKKQGLLRDINYSDCVILMDRTTDFDLYKKVFEYFNIPLEIYKDEVLNREMDTIVLSNLLYLIKLIKENTYDTSFRYYFASIARSFLFRLSDQEILDIIKNNKYYEQELFLKCKEIADKLDYLTPPELLDLVVDNFKLYENIIKIGNISSSLKRLDYIFNLSYELMDLGYDTYGFVDYLNKMNSDDYEIKYIAKANSRNAVKIMTIHKSKGLEFPVCYFSGLYKSFNISDLKEKILFDNNIGIILPYFNEGINDSVSKYILKDRFIREEISEKIRLFYVALTRAREKIIMVIPKRGNDFTVENRLTDNAKLRYRSLGDIIYSTNHLISNFVKDVDINELGITKNYNIISNKDFTTDSSDYKKVSVTELNLNSDLIESNKFSKKQTQTLTKSEYQNIQLGLELHKILENIDFHNPDYSLIDNDYYKSIITRLFKNIEVTKDTKVYQEYEFMYEGDNNLYHGVIDLMLEHNDHIQIIDYKLRNTDDDEYRNQLEGYKKYIEN